MLGLEFSTSMYKSFQMKKNECKSDTSWREICMIILMLWQDTDTQKFESECYFLYLQGLLNVAKYHPVLLADPTDKNLWEPSVKLTLLICFLCRLGLKIEME